MFCRPLVGPTLLGIATDTSIGYASVSSSDIQRELLAVSLQVAVKAEGWEDFIVQTSLHVAWAIRLIL